MDILRTVKTFIDQYHLLDTGDRIVVGVSGGPDSVALLHILHTLAKDYHLELHVAHLNHGIRGEDADADMQHVQRIASALNLPCSIAHEDVPALSLSQGQSLEEAARIARYAFFYRIAKEINAKSIAVGHNADDQAETILMHLLRGAGPAGLRGMLPRAPLHEHPEFQLIRPLLGTTREHVEAYCHAHNLQVRTDVTNLDTAYFRNRLRHEVLPYLDNVNPGIRQRLVNLGEVIRADYQLIQEFTQIAWDTLLVAEYPDTLRFELPRWREQPLSIQRAIIRRAAYSLCHSLRDIDFSHIDQVIHVLQNGSTGTMAVLPHHLVVTVEYDTFSIGEKDALHLPPARPWLKPDQIIAINLPGVTPLPHGWTLHTQFAQHWHVDLIADNPDPLVAWMDSAALGASPILRTRKPGDRFAPQGMAGSTVKLGDFLINRKFPRHWRSYLPLVCNQHDIVWVPGIHLSENVVVTESTRQVIYMCFRGPGS